MKSYLLETIQQSPKYYPCAICYPFSAPKVINMITKKKYWNKPTYESFTIALKEVRDICIARGIKYLAMPKIECGLDRFQWGKVREIIQEIFKNLDIEIEVRYL